MRRRARARLIAVLGAVACFVAHVGTNIAQDSLVIRYHYSGWRTIHIITTVALVISVAVLAFDLATAGLRKLRQKKAVRIEAESTKRREAEQSESKKLRDPEDIRQFFIQICNCGRSQCAGPARQIVEQLNQMNDHQSTFERLLEINDISAVAESTRKLLQDIEDSICDSCREAINRYIINDFDGFERAAKKIHAKNAAVLTEVQSFLKTMADFASGQNNGEDATRCLASYNETIREAMQREDF